MKCKQIDGMLSAYHDSELSTQHRDQVRKHLAICPSCEQKFQVLVSTSAIFQGLPYEPAPDNLAERCLAQLEPSQPLESGPTPLRQPNRLRWGLGFAAAACLLMTVLWNSREQDDSYPDTSSMPGYWNYQTDVPRYESQDETVDEDNLPGLHIQSSIGFTIRMLDEI